MMIDDLYKIRNHFGLYSNNLSKNELYIHIDSLINEMVEDSDKEVREITIEDGDGDAFTICSDGRLIIENLSKEFIKPIYSLTDSIDDCINKVKLFICNKQQLLDENEWSNKPVFSLKDSLLKSRKNVKYPLHDASYHNDIDTVIKLL